MLDAIFPFTATQWGAKFSYLFAVLGVIFLTLGAGLPGGWAERELVAAYTTIFIPAVDDTFASDGIIRAGLFAIEFKRTKALDGLDLEDLEDPGPVYRWSYASKDFPAQFQRETIPRDFQGRLFVSESGVNAWVIVAQAGIVCSILAATVSLTNLSIKYNMYHMKWGVLMSLISGVFGVVPIILWLTKACGKAPPDNCDAPEYSTSWAINPNGEDETCNTLTENREFCCPTKVFTGDRAYLYCCTTLVPLFPDENGHCDLCFPFYLTCVGVALQLFNVILLIGLISSISTGRGKGGGGGVLF